MACSIGNYLDSNFACDTCSNAITNCLTCSANPNLVGTICDVC